MSDDIIIIGAGVVGCATAYFLARAGVRVSVFDACDIGSGASGRNAGVVEHPYDLPQEPLYAETVSLLSEALGPAMPKDPVGVLLVANNQAAAERAAAHHGRFRQLNPTVIAPGELAYAEPLLASDIWACRLQTGYPIQPALVAATFADHARQLGARFHLRRPAKLLRDRHGVCGVSCRGNRHQAQAVVVAAGAASSQVVDPTGGWQPILPLWGVLVSVELPQHPRHVLLEDSVASIQAAAEPDDSTAFSLITTGDSLTLGSTFLHEEPPGKEWVSRLLSHGKRFCPLLEDARVGSVLTCARPRSFDGRPLLGKVAEEARLWVAAGHGGRGISTGLASARLLVDAIQSGTDDGIAAELRADRFANVPGAPAGAR